MTQYYRSATALLYLYSTCACYFTLLPVTARPFKRVVLLPVIGSSMYNTLFAPVMIPVAVMDVLVGWFVCC
jgi:hypothetical protein